MSGYYESSMRTNLRRHWWRPWKMLRLCIVIAQWADEDMARCRARPDHEAEREGEG